MQQIPALFAQMRENLDPARVPKIHSETVAKQNAVRLALVDQFITPNADKLEGDDRKQLDDAVATLRKAVAGQQEWLDNTLVPNATGDFRIGADLFDQKLKFSLTSRSQGHTSGLQSLMRNSYAVFSLKNNNSRLIQ